MEKDKLYQPTEAELEILQVLWEKGPSTVRDVHDYISKSKDVGYTTTLKLMQIMAEKNILSRDTSQRQHVYIPTISQEKTQGIYLKKMLNGLFSGSASRMVIGALNSHQPSREELQEIKDYLSQFEKLEL